MSFPFYENVMSLPLFTTMPLTRTSLSFAKSMLLPLYKHVISACDNVTFILRSCHLSVLRIGNFDFTSRPCPFFWREYHFRFTSMSHTSPLLQVGHFCFTSMSLPFYERSSYKYWAKLRSKSTCSASGVFKILSTGMHTIKDKEKERMHQYISGSTPHVKHTTRSLPTSKKEITNKSMTLVLLLFVLN